VIHLWHQSQPLKLENENKNVKRARDLAATAIEKRIERLKSKNKLV
jgi:ribosome-associated translation inhibitor RaiA